MPNSVVVDEIASVVPTAQIQRSRTGLLRCGASSIAVGHEHKMVLDFEDKDHITERWTWRKNGKGTDMVYHLARKQ